MIGTIKQIRNTFTIHIISWKMPSVIAFLSCTYQHLVQFCLITNVNTISRLSPSLMICTIQIARNRMDKNLFERIELVNEFKFK